MDFSVNNNGINKIDTIKKKENEIEKDNQQTQGENRDYTESYSTLSSFSRAQFQATQRLSHKAQGKLETPLDFKRVFVNTTAPSEEETDNIMLQHGFTQEQITDLRGKVTNLNTIVKTFDTLQKYVQEDFSPKQIKDIIEIDTDKDSLNLIKLLNENNLGIVKEKFNIEDNEKACEILMYIIERIVGNKDTLGKNFQKALEIHKFVDLNFGTICYKINDTNLDSLSLEQIKAQSLIDKTLDRGINFDNARFITNPADITPEFIEQYKEKVNKLDNLNIATEEKEQSPQENLAEMELVAKFCDENNLNFDWYQLTGVWGNDKAHVSINKIIDIINSKEPAKAIEFINSCSDSCKSRDSSGILELSTNEMIQRNPQGYAELFNTLSSLKSDKELYNLSEFSYYFTHLAKRGSISKDPIGASEFIRACDDVGKFPQRDESYEIMRMDKTYDYKNMAKFVRKIAKLYPEDKTLIENIKADRNYETAVQILDKLENYDKENLPSIKLLTTILDRNDPTALDKAEFYKKLGFEEYQTMNTLKLNIPLEEQTEKFNNFINKLKEEHPLLQDMETDAIWAIITNDHNASQNAFIHILDYENTNIDDLSNLSGTNNPKYLIKEDSKDIFLKLLKERPKDITMNHIVNISGDFNQWYVDDEMKKLKIDFLEKTLFNEESPFNTQEICELLPKITMPETAEIVDLLLKDPKFTPEEISKFTNLLYAHNRDIALQLLKQKDSRYQASELIEIIKVINNDYSPELAKEICLNNKYNIPTENVANIIAAINDNNEKFADKILSNNKLNIPYENIAQILRAISLTNKDFVEKICFDDEYNIPHDEKAGIIGAIRVDKEKFAKKLLSERTDIPFSEKKNIITSYRAECNDFAEKLCFSNEHGIDINLIPSIMHYTKEYKQDFAETLCFDEELKYPKELISDLLAAVTPDNMDIAQKLALDKDKDFPKEKIPAILRVIDDKNKPKLEKIINHPQLYEWFKKNAANDLSLNLIIELSKTQNKLLQESEQALTKEQKAEAKAQKAEVKKQEIIEAKSEDIEKAQQILVDLGVHPKMAPNYIKLCQENGIVDYMKLDAVCALAKVDVPFKEFKNIFNIAVGSPLSNMNGQFRIDLIKDIVKLKENGIEDVKLATNLAATKNMSDIELHSRLNPNIRTDMTTRLDNLSEEVKTNLINAGFDLDSIKEKALKKPKARNINQDLAPKNPIVLRSLDSIVGAEKVVLNKFKHDLPQETWANPEAFKKWAEDKLENIINAENDFELKPDFKATGKYSCYNESRKEGIKKWYEYLNKESNYKDDVFTHLLVMDGITREMRPDNAYTPPSISHESFEATYNALLEENTKISFSDMYANLTKAKAIAKYGKEPTVVDGIEGQWVTIPRSQRGEPDYDENIAMVQALAEGSSWCLRFENAHNYLRGGNLHYFLDKNGKAQVAINETDGVITQIQKRYGQNSTVPVAHSVVVDEWAKDNNYTGWESQRKTALESKPKFDERRAKIAEYIAKNDYLSIFKELGIKVTEESDGTYSLENYDPNLGAYYVAELGINENDLMSNVSKANKLYLEGSNLTALPNLREIKRLDLKDCSINDFRSLEKIGDKPVYWIK